MAKLSRADEDAILTAYEEWDGNDVDGFVSSLPVKISKQTVYNLLARRGVPRKRYRSGTSPSPEREVAEQLYERMAKHALTAILDENDALRRENAELRESLNFYRPLWEQEQETKRRLGRELADGEIFRARRPI